MDEFTIGFEDNAVWRELTFRGVTEAVARALACGLVAAGDYGNVTLTGSQPAVIDLDAPTP